MRGIKENSRFRPLIDQETISASVIGNLGESLLRIRVPVIQACDLLIASNPPFRNTYPTLRG